MFSCNYCSLTFTTEQELNVHMEQCDKNTQPPMSETSDLDLYICESCTADFETAEELAMHEKTCEMKKLTATLAFYSSQLEELTRNLKISDKAVALKSKHCGNCKMSFTTREDYIAHRRTCIIRKVRKLLQKLNINLEERKSSASSPYSYESKSDEENAPLSGTPLTSEHDSSVQTNLINPVDVSRAICSAMPPSTSKDCSVQKSDRKRPLQTSSTSDSSLESPPSKTFVLSEMKQEITTDSTSHVAIPKSAPLSGTQLTSERDSSVQTNLINPVDVSRAICSAMPPSTSQDCSVQTSDRKRPLQTSSTSDSGISSAEKVG
ncbi:uncharacterized protein LOC109851742 isoform X2 [Pseudomyrmex gracilis]|uniref:uncharacterized protein LOC109851742 isoform X2 n=1 Tax=Pseudomyrmex gracilis TaxID=219809 RepID=UPI000995CC40|nr:uncharacterized protein LOC109851742 isoform X2 [Pseudomyrmex gracilis]